MGISISVATSIGVAPLREGEMQTLQLVLPPPSDGLKQQPARPTLRPPIVDAEAVSAAPVTLLVIT